MIGFHCSCFRNFHLLSASRRSAVLLCCSTQCSLDCPHCCRCLSIVAVDRGGRLVYGQWQYHTGAAL